MGILGLSRTKSLKKAETEARIYRESGSRVQADNLNLRSRVEVVSSELHVSEKALSEVVEQKTHLALQNLKLAEDFENLQNLHSGWERVVVLRLNPEALEAALRNQVVPWLKVSVDENKLVVYVSGPITDAQMNTLMAKMPKAERV